MIQVSAEGTEFLLVLASEASLAFESQGIEPTELNRRLAAGSDTRLVLFRGLLPPHGLSPSWMCWQREPNVSQIESAASAGEVNDAQYEYAFRTTAERITCPSCGGEQDALIVDAGEPYPKAPGLHEEKVRRLRSLSCPRCNASFRRLVAKLL